MTNNITNYIIYLSIKLIIQNEMHTKQSNCTIAQQLIKDEFKNYKTKNPNYKDNDINNIEFTKSLFIKHKCYNVIDINYSECLTHCDAIDVYNMYKMYKQSLNQQTKSTKKVKSPLTLDNSIDTSDVYYIESFDKNIINTNILEKLFGKSQSIQHEKCRYEYKFKLVIKKKIYKISLYDWKNESNNFEEYKNIEWHIGMENEDEHVTNKKVIKIFKNMIEKIKLENEKCDDHEDKDDDCC